MSRMVLSLGEARILRMCLSDLLSHQTGHTSDRDQISECHGLIIIRSDTIGQQHIPADPPVAAIGSGKIGNLRQSRAGLVEDNIRVGGRVEAFRKKIETGAAISECYPHGKNTLHCLGCFKISVQGGVLHHTTQEHFSSNAHTSVNPYGIALAAQLQVAQGIIFIRVDLSKCHIQIGGIPVFLNPIFGYILDPLFLLSIELIDLVLQTVDHITQGVATFLHPVAPFISFYLIDLTLYGLAIHFILGLNV